MADGEKVTLLYLVKEKTMIPDSDIGKLSKYGLVGVMIALIMLAAYGVYQSSAVGLSCAQAHDATNEVLKKFIETTTKLNTLLELKL